MDYYKVLSENEKHFNMQYKTGLNINVEDFYPHGDCAEGGMYFAREDILAYLSCGVWLRKVTIPDDAQVYENPGYPKKWKADRFILGERERINLDVIKRLHHEGADIHVYREWPLRWASQTGNLDFVEYLVENGSDVHVYEDFPLRLASENGHLGIVKYLVEHGSFVNAFHDAALRWALIKKYMDIVEYLIAHGADKSYLNK